MIDLSGQTALVTGGARGIGKSIVLALAKQGANICFTNRSKAGAEALEQELKEIGTEAFSFQGDVAKEEDCAEVIKQTVDRFGKIDILVNNAGITRDNLMMRMKKDDWDDVINTNLSGVFLMAKAALRPMMKKKYGRIINIGSIVGDTGNPGQVNYASTKAGIIGFSKSLAKEVASRNITCNVIAPGFIETDMTNELSEEQKTNLLKEIPMGRMGSGDDIAKGVLYLASSMGGYVTGTTLHINGGMY